MEAEFIRAFGPQTSSDIEQTKKQDDGSRSREEEKEGGSKVK
jgi:hypothetical protein